MTTNEKIDKTLEVVNKIKESIATLVAHQQSQKESLDLHKERIDNHEEKIEILDAHRNKTYGVIAVLGMTFGAVATWLLHMIK